VNHPIAMLGLLVNCGGDVRRDYPILLQPPVLRVGAGTSPNLPVAAPVEDTAPRPPVQARPPRPPRAAVAPAAEGTGPARGSQPADATAPVTKTPKASRREAAAARRTEPPRHDRLILGSGAEAGLVPLRMSLALLNPPSEDESDGARQRCARSSAPSPRSTTGSPQLEVNEKIKRLEEYQAMLKEKGRPARRRPPAAHAAVRLRRPRLPPRLLRRPSRPRRLPPDIAEQLHVWGAPVAA
jgi:hypothetical protein